MNDITLTEIDGGLYLKAPYYADANTDYRKIGGKWKDDRRAWRFDVRDRDRVREVLQTHFGRDDRPVLKTVTVRVDLDKAAHGREPEIRMFGRIIATRLYRDAEVRLGEGVILIEGAFKGRGGSVKYPAIDEIDGIVLEVRDVPAGHQDLEDDGVEVVADGNGPELDALEAERAQLVARLAEVNAAIAAATSAPTIHGD